MEIPVRVARTFADLQSAAKAGIDNGTKIARSAGVAPTSRDLESRAHRFEYHDRRNSLLEHDPVRGIRAELVHVENVPEAEMLQLVEMISVIFFFDVYQVFILFTV